MVQACAHPSDEIRLEMVAPCLATWLMEGSGVLIVLPSGCLAMKGERRVYREIHVWSLLWRPFLASLSQGGSSNDNDSLSSQHPRPVRTLGEEDLGIPTGPGHS